MTEKKIDDDSWNVLKNQIQSSLGWANETIIQKTVHFVQKWWRGHLGFKSERATIIDFATFATLTFSLRQMQYVPQYKLNVRVAVKNARKYPYIFNSVMYFLLQLR